MEKISKFGSQLLDMFHRIYLSDDSIIANIAFGVSSEDIDYDSVERVAKIKFT